MYVVVLWLWISIALRGIKTLAGLSLSLLEIKSLIYPVLECTIIYNARRSSKGFSHSSKASRMIVVSELYDTSSLRSSEHSSRERRLLFGLSYHHRS